MYSYETEVAKVSLSVNAIYVRKEGEIYRNRERERGGRYHFGFLLSLDFLGSLLYLSLKVGTATVGVHLVLAVLLLTLGERQPKVRN